MSKRLRTYQEEVVEWGAVRSRCALFLEMRLGKTLCAIRILKKHKAHRVLILAPKSVVPVWQKELREESCPSSWEVLGYEAWLAGGGKEDWDAVVLDESTKIKNPKAKLTKTVLSDLRMVPVKLILTGMPRPEHVFELFTQLCFVFGSFMGYDSFWAWRKRYFVQRGYKWFPCAGTMEAIQRVVDKSCYSLSQREAGHAFLPEREVWKVPLGQRQAEFYKQAQELWKVEEQETNYATTAVQWLRQIAGGTFRFSEGERQRVVLSCAKVDRLLRELEGREWKRCVVFAYFLQELELIRNALLASDLKLGEEQPSILSLQGESTLYERETILQRTLETDSWILVCQVETGKFGLDFARADALIFYSNSWSCEARTQAEARGTKFKEQPGKIIDIVTEGTIDEYVVKELAKKKLRARNLTSRVQDHIRSLVPNN